MILQALYDYYQRAELAPPGWEKREIPFVIVLDRNGQFVMIENRTDDQNKRGRSLLMPASENRSGLNAWMKPNLLWDHYGFILGIQKHKPNGELDPTDTPEKAERQRRSFADRISKLQEQFPESAGLQSLKIFYESDEYKSTKIKDDPTLKEVLKIPGANLSFRLVDSAALIAHEPWVNAYMSQADVKPNDDEDSGHAEFGTCLVTGKGAEITRLHPKAKGVSDKPTPLLSANTTAYPAYSSYGKSQGFMFPVSKQAAFAYTTALNHLLAKGSRNRFQVGETSTVCWAERQGETVSEYDVLFADIFGHHDDPNAGVKAVTTLFESVQNGRFDGAEGTTRYFVLGLAPNVARISVRFFYSMTLAELALHIVQHFDDLALRHADYEPKYLALSRLLTGLAVLGKIDNIPNNLSGEIMCAIINDLPYPATVLNLAIQRCRADQARKNDKTGKPVPNVSYERAASIKAYLNRIYRYRNEQEKELSVALDNTLDPAYRLGRLFAVFERMQETASGRDLNRTIRDSFFGSAMSTPRSVFPRLIRLNQHHLRDLKRSQPKSAGYFDSLLQEINSALQPADAFPAFFNLEDQGRFALGYYHQRQAFFTKSDKTESTEENN